MLYYLIAIVLGVIWGLFFNIYAFILVLFIHMVVYTIAFTFSPYSIISFVFLINFFLIALNGISCYLFTAYVTMGKYRRGQRKPKRLETQEAAEASRPVS
jgi:predicted membrane protein